MRNVSVFDISIGQLAAATVFAVPLALPSIASVHVAPLLWPRFSPWVPPERVSRILLYYYVMNTLGRGPWPRASRCWFR